MKVVFFGNIYYDYEFGVVWPIGFLLPQPAYNSSNSTKISHDQFAAQLRFLHECMCVVQDISPLLVSCWESSERSASVAVLSDIYHNDHWSPQAYHGDLQPDFQNFLKKPQNMFSRCFLSVSRYFSIVRNLCWEPHFWAENRIFKNFSKSLKTCFVGVFWMFQCIFLALFDIWARIFEPRTRWNSWKASKHV